MNHMRLISLDIETYGSCTHTHDGRTLPTQTVFHPARSLHTDKVDPADLVLSVSVTTEASSCPCGKRRGQPEFSPCCTMVMYPHSHMVHIRKWIEWATDILGMNLPFDLQYLRHYSPGLRLALHNRHTLHDLSILNYLHSELRPERSLKSLGPVLGTHAYDRTIKDGKFKSPHEQAFIDYAAQDTHNTMLAARELRRRIHQDWPSSGKLGPDAIRHYSDLIWTVVTMAEAGIPMDTNMLEARLHQLMVKGDKATALSSLLGLRLEGEGSAKSKEAFLDRCITLATSHSSENLLDHPLLQYTEKTRKISWSDGNRNLLLSHLPAHSPEARGLWLAGIHSRAQKQLSSYLYPLLHGRRNKPDDKGDTVIPWQTYPKTSSIGSNSLSTSLRTPSVVTPSSFGSHSRTSPRPSPICTPPTSCVQSSSAKQSDSACSTSPLKESTRASSGKRKTKAPSSASSPSLFDLPSTCRSSSTQSVRTSTSSSPTPSFTPSTTKTRTTGPKATGAAYPVWFIVPSSSKDASGDEGGTIQARITCKRPSAQTFPPEIKACIQSRWQGGSIISMDLSQIELRMAALCSGDPSLLAAFNSGLDLHTDRAVQLFGPDSTSRPTFKKRERQVGKTMNFADLFLASPQRMRMSVHEMTGELMPLSFFEEVARSRPDARPGLHRWQQSLISRVATDGYLLLPILGQSRTFVGGPAAHLNEIVNFPIQTQASNTLLQIQARLNPRLSAGWPGPRPLMFLQVYDAIYFDVPPGHEAFLRDSVAQAVQEVGSPTGYWGRLQEFYGNTVPLEYEID